MTKEPFELQNESSDFRRGFECGKIAFSLSIGDHVVRGMTHNDDMPFIRELANQYDYTPCFVQFGMSESPIFFFTAQKTIHTN